AQLRGRRPLSSSEFPRGLRPARAVSGNRAKVGHLPRKTSWLRPAKDWCFRVCGQFLPSARVSVQIPVSSRGARASYLELGSIEIYLWQRGQKKLDSSPAEFA